MRRTIGVEAELARQCRPTPRDARFDRADRNVEHRGDLCVVEVGNVAKYHGDAQVLGHHAVVVEIEGPAGAGQIVERALGDRLRDALLDDAVQEPHGGQWRGGA